MYRILAAVFVAVLALLVSVAPAAQAASGPWSSVSAGYLHTCAISTEKSLYCWGRNIFGEIGDGTSGEDRLSPTKVGSSGAWAEVSAGYNHTCAISTGKSLYCWGINDVGRLGDGTTEERHSPKKIGTSGVWATVSAGNGHTCAISTGKSLYCWGSNNFGQIGDGASGGGNDRHSPRKIGTSGVWATVSAGEQHTCAITTGRSLYCWGDNKWGQIGDGTDTERPSPKRIGTSGGWAQAIAGDFHTCAITTGKSLYCWGYNALGQVGDGTNVYPRLSPRKVGTSGVWAGADAGGLNGGGHTCAVSTGKSLYCWGYNIAGELGDGTVTERHAPKKIGTSGAWGSADAGSNHTCAVSTGQSLYCWGYNEFGQVGDGTTSQRLTPRKVP
jgi:alpha-tubulin suppressor-like RCC1 family protein